MQHGLDRFASVRKTPGAAVGARSFDQHVLIGVSVSAIEWP
jgi:hypothetical protein